MRLICIIAMAMVAAGRAAAAPAGPAPAALIDRVTWGQTPEAVREAQRMGVDRWLAAQLKPSPAPLPAVVEAQLHSMRIVQTPMERLVFEMAAANKAADGLADPAERQAAKQAYRKQLTQLKQEAAARSLLRDLYSPNQLQEQMTWFWFNHFNVQADKRDIRAMIGDYEDQAIRPHALGKFRDLLNAADLHPAMLRYLDNDKNAAGRLNENFAREILELHTLGVGAGYTQADVEQMARVLTGVGIAQSPDAPRLRPELRDKYERRGLMEFNPAKHDFGPKTVLGRSISASGLSEFEDTLDYLARQPATAKHISSKLAAYFMDDPPTGVIDRMSAAFLKSDGDIAQVLSVLFHASEFQASLGKKLKDPVHYAVSAVRLSYGDQPITNTLPLQNWINRLGQGLYGRETPDGYPLDAGAWSGPGQLTGVFEVARQLASNKTGLFSASDAGTLSVEPATPSADRLRATAQTIPLSNTTTSALSQARSPTEWGALFLSSPEFLYR